MIPNKRADVPVTILVIGIVAICALALLSFDIVNGTVRNNFFGPGLMEVVDSVDIEIQANGISKTSFQVKNIYFRKGEVRILIDTIDNKIIGKYISDSGKLLAVIEKKISN